MIRYFCNLVEGTNLPLSGACIDTDFSNEPPEDHPYEISEEVFNNLYRAQLIDDVWILTPVEDLPPAEPEPKTPEQLQIEALQQQLATLQAAMDDMILGGAL